MGKKLLIALVFVLGGGAACNYSLRSSAGAGSLAGGAATSTTSSAMIASLSTAEAPQQSRAEPGNLPAGDVFEAGNGKCKSQCTTEAGECRTSCSTAKCANDCNKAERDCKNNC